MINEQTLENFFASFGLVIIALCILMIIAMWKIFTKAGEAGWKSLIPIYDMHVYARVCWKASYFWYSVLITAVLYGIGAGVGGGFGIFLEAVAGLVELVYMIMSMNHLARRFGKSNTFTVLLILLNTIGLLILAYGPADYQMIRDPDTKGM